MLATNDQENRVFCHPFAGMKSSNQEAKRFQTSTSGSVFSKTPLRIPLQNENVMTILGRKSGNGKEVDNTELGGKPISKFNRNAFITPSGPRARAPLGMKTTNANTNVFPKPIGTIAKIDVEKSQPKQTSIRRPKKFIHSGSIKLEIHEDESPLTDRELEYCPPRPKDLPYESDTFPDNCLDYSLTKPENLWKDLQRHQCPQEYTLDLDREHELAYKQDIKDVDDFVQNMIKEEWTVGDVPETFRHLEREISKARNNTVDRSRKLNVISHNGPQTLTSRRAALALTTASQASANQPKEKAKSKFASSFYPLSQIRTNPIPTNSSKTDTMRHTASIATSKSTIGYTKGRKVPSILQNSKSPVRILKKSFSGISMGSDTTTALDMINDEGWRNPHFLKVFETESDDPECSLSSSLPPYIQEDEEEFFVTV